MWANEGFAELFAIGSVVKDEFWVGDIPETWLMQLHARAAATPCSPSGDSSPWEVMRGIMSSGG